MRTLFSQFVQDIQYALRTMSKSPVFTAMAALSLALGIGANTAIYSFMEAILMRALPVAAPESLVLVAWHSKDFPKVSRSFSGNNYRDPKTGFTSGNFPYPAFERLHGESSVLSSLAGFSAAGRLNIIAQGSADLAEATYVTGDFFRTLGLGPSAGRLLDANDDRDAAAVAVLSDGYARRRFGSPAEAIGKSLLINNVPFTVAGIASPGFFGVNPARTQDLYIPMRSGVLLATSPDTFGRRFAETNSYWIEMIGRLRPDVSRTRAEAQLAGVFGGFVTGTASNDAERADLPALFLQDGAGGLGSLRRQYSKPLQVLMTMVGLILAIACANVANLLLARGAGRSREIALRLSLGAGRGRLIRQLLTESVVLASLGGILGVLFAWWGIQGITALMANGRPDFTFRAALNWNVLATTVALSLATGLLFGFVPALQATRLNLSFAMKQVRAGAAVRRWRWLPSMTQSLVAVQIAISLLLLVGAGLFARSLANLHAVELGFNAEKLLVVSLNARQAGYRGEDLARFYDGLRRRFAAIPGVRAVTSSDIALVTQSMSSSGVELAGFSGREANSAHLRTGPGFFATMQIPLLLGRDFEERDNRSGINVAVVNEAFARKFFAGQNPLGRRFGIAGQKDIEIIGVARAARYVSLKEESPTLVYLLYGNNPTALFGIHFELRATGDPLSIASAASKAVAQADSRVPVSQINTQKLRIEQTISQERTFATLCIGFAVLAVVIACVGLYGSMAYSVARRTSEIGVRMALGGQRSRIVGMVLRDVVAVAVGGLAVGLPAAWAAARLIETFLFGMKARDPLVFAVAGLVLLLAAIAAGFGPARRASCIDPWSALRND